MAITKLMQSSFLAISLVQITFYSDILTHSLLEILPKKHVEASQAIFG